MALLSPPLSCEAEPGPSPAVLACQRSTGLPSMPGVCPQCESTQIGPHGTSRLKDGTPQQRFKCKACGKTFNRDTGTPMAYAKKRDKLRRFVESMGSGAPLRQHAAELKVALATAFRWRHLVLATILKPERRKLAGPVAMAETYVAHSRKGQRQKPERFQRIRDGRASCVLIFLSKSGFRSHIAGPGRLCPEALELSLWKVVTPKAQVCTVGSPAPAEACQILSMEHRDGTHLTEDGPEGLHRLMKVATRFRAGLHGWKVRFFGVATRYLHHYLAWYDTLYQTRALALLQRT